MKTLTREDIQILEDIYEEMLKQEDKEFADDRNYKAIRKKLKDFIDSSKTNTQHIITDKGL
jgi:hypothetical protein